VVVELVLVELDDELLVDVEVDVEVVVARESPS